MGELKPGWRRVKFGEVVRLGKERCDPVSDGVERYIGLEHIEPCDLRVRSWGDVSDGTTFTTRVRPGHVLFGKRRAYQRKVAVADFDAVCSGDIYVFESANPAKLMPELLPFLCQTDAFFDYAVGTSAGSLSPRTNWTSLAEYEFALPPLAEQRRIARVLATATASISATSEAIACGATARDALLKSLYMGGIRGGRPVSDTSVGPVPTGWRVDPLGEHFQVQLGKMMSENARGGDGHIPYLRNANVQWNTLELDDVATMAFSEQEREKFSLRYGDILACEGRHVGKSAMWREEIPGACYQKALHRLRAIRDDVPSYLLHCLRYYSITGRFGGATVETTIPHLPAEKLRAMHFPFPSREEQVEIADTIDTYDRSLERLRVRYQHASGLLAKLLPSESA